MEQGRNKAVEYQKIKLYASAFHLFLILSLLAVAVFSPLSSFFKQFVVSVTNSYYLGIALFFFLFSIYIYIFAFPFSIFFSYLLEKKYNLSEQSFGGWFFEGVKKSVLSFLLSLFLVEIFYLVVHTFEKDWWWIAWVGWLAFSILLGRLAPILIFPLFYKFKPLDNEVLRLRLLNLVKSGGLALDNVYMFNMSKTTKKANAAFCGMGKTRRVILSDNLLENFTEDEVEMVVAHEMGHCRLNHLWKRVGWGTVTTLAVFFLLFHLSNIWVSFRGGESIGDVVFLPFLFLLISLFGIISSPLENAFSRKHEYEADAFAIKTIPRKDVFQSLMEKLAELNLANPNPHPLIEFLLYDHPSISHRIKRVQTLK